MGFLKWWKGKRKAVGSPHREGGFEEDDVSSNPRLNEKPSFGNKKKKLSRNDSYSKALSKFIIWRQVHLSSKATRKKILSKSTPNNKKINNECIKMDNDCIQMNNECIQINNKSINNHEGLNSSKIIYEEVYININSRNLKYNPEFLKRNKISSKYDHNSSSRLTCVYSCLNDLSISTSNNDRFDASEYAVQLNSHDNSHEIGVTMCRNYSQTNLEITNENNLCNEFKEEFREHVLVTDLDNSEGEIASLNNCTNKVEKSFNPAFINQQSDLLVCSLEQIKYKDHVGFNTVNGYMQHGEVDSIEITSLQMQDYCSDGIYNSLNILRKLRHPNIVLLMGVSIGNSSILEGLVMEPLMSTLFGSIHLEKNFITVENCYKYAVQITNAISFLHKQHYIHSNVCSQNILMCKDTGIVKLGGFELCISSKDDKDHNDLRLHKQLSTAYRQQYNKYIYQATELLSGTKTKFKPSFYSDIYGVCITLWEMLTSEIPYELLDEQELIDALQKTQLPVYETERYAPFKSILEKGLEINSENRFTNSVELKKAFLEVKLPTRDLPTVSDSLDKCHSANFNIVSKSNGLHYDRTSTIRKHNSSKFNKTQTKICDWENFNKTCSPIRTDDSPLNWNNLNSNSTKFAESMVNSQNTNENLITPKKKYNVNILLRSKCSPNSNSQNELLNHVEKPLNELITRSNVKEKITKFESFSTSTSINNRSESLEVLHVNHLKNTKDKDKEECRNICLDNGINKLKNEGKGLKENHNLVQTEDFYIDDDILNNGVLGCNFELNLHREMRYFKHMYLFSL